MDHVLGEPAGRDLGTPAPRSVEKRPVVPDQLDAVQVRLSTLNLTGLPLIQTSRSSSCAKFACVPIQSVTHAREARPPGASCCRISKWPAGSGAPCALSLGGLLLLRDDLPFLSRPPFKTLERSDVPLERPPHRDLPQDPVEFLVGGRLCDEDKRPVPNTRGACQDLNRPVSSTSGS